LSKIKINFQIILLLFSFWKNCRCHTRNDRTWTCESSRFIFQINSNLWSIYTISNFNCEWSSNDIFGSLFSDHGTFGFDISNTLFQLYSQDDLSRDSHLRCVITCELFIRLIYDLNIVKYVLFLDRLFNRKTFVENE
jgi:hypothetical protein